ncbi:MAG: transketolase [Solirubrobacterales bacterium]|nr:transketolase [Solirubrobacterales bacterium]
MDAVEAANSGHPGLPLAMAPAAYLLYARIMVHDPEDPSWPDRDRFVLSAGHGSALLYSVLHLCGYDLPMEELKRFRQWGSATPGHPERESDAPIETTTGPLGQGFANAVGMAMAERFLRERYGEERMDHHIYGICSDGDLMEGVSAEAASLAGHLGLGRLNFLYDDNRITIDGSTELSFDTEDVEARFRAYGWHTSSVDDANDVDALEEAILAAKAETDRPSLIRVRSVIGWPAPTKSGTAGAHGSPLGADEVRDTKRLLGLDPEATFAVSDEARAAFDDARRVGRDAHQAWADRVAGWRGANPDAGAEWDSAWAGKPIGDIAACLPHFDDEKMATRSAGGKVMQAFADLVPTMVGGSADLVGSTKTEFAGEQSFTRATAGRNVHWGIREHAMGASVNGMAAHGGIVKPFGSTFLVFSDYMRPSIRLSAVMGLPVVWIFTHDSIGVGEDGPTHQPIEHYAALRAIPGLTVIRPGDANETAQAWRVALEEDGPVCLLLTRQDLPVLDRSKLGDAKGVELGGYTLAGGEGAPDAVIVATGSEVSVALDSRAELEGAGLDVRVVSMPSWELYDRQPQDYRDEVLPPGAPVISIEAGISQGWERYASGSVAIDRFGASAPGPEVFEHLGITAEAVSEAVRSEIAKRAS